MRSKTNFLLLIIFFSLSSCSSIHKTFLFPNKKGEKVFAGTQNNINWVSEAPRMEFYPYSVMGLFDFIPSVAADLILLPYTLYDKYAPDQQGRPTSNQ